MYLQPYQLAELKFAFTNRIYSRVQSHRRRQNLRLSAIQPSEFTQTLVPYDIHILEFVSTCLDARLMVSLKLNESVSAAVSKIKGRLSKFLNQGEDNSSKTSQLAKGYFATTIGNSTAEEVVSYLEKQSRHHDYDLRARPPIYSMTFPRDQATQETLKTDHAVTCLRYHLVFTTEFRRGVFGDSSGKLLTAHWRSLQLANRFVIDKVSFLPDHVHVAIETHPMAKLADVVVLMMNTAQDFMWTNFEAGVIQASIRRLWQPSAYVGSFGDLTSAAIRAYLKKWEDHDRG